jgi:hypothetical protein
MANLDSTANLNSTILKLCKKYSTIDSSIIMERNSILNTKELVNNICNMMTTTCSDDDLSRQIMASSLGGGNKMLTDIIETNEELGTSNFNNTISWKWTKAQLKVNEQRDKIDLLVCELVKAIVDNNYNLMDSNENNECETDYLEAVEQKTLDDYETYLAVKSFLYAVSGAFVVNIMFAYFNFK